MADFPPARPAEAAGFADAEGREVVVQKETLRGFAATVGVDVLRLLDWRERGQRHRLRFAPLEDGRTMGAREDSDLAGDLAQVVIAAAVNPLLLVENVAAEGFLLDVIKRLVDREFIGFREFFEHCRLHFVAQTADRLAPCHFALGIERGFDPTARHAVRDLEDFRLHFEQRHFALRLADLGREFLLDADHFAGVTVSKFKRLDELILWQFVGGAFDHDYVVLSADVNQIKIALLTLGMGRIGDELAVDTTDAHGTDWAVERNIGNAERGGGAIDCENIGIIFAIGAEQDRDNLRVVKITRREERPKRPISHARRERFLFAWTTFAFEIAAGKLPDCRRFFSIIDGQRKPILAFLQRGGRDGTGEDDGLAAGDNDGAVGELGNFACFDVDLRGPDLGRDLVLHTSFWMCEVQAGHPDSRF